MGTKLRDKLNQLDPARRERIQEAAHREKAVYLTLQQLRKMNDETQVGLAETMGIKQETVSKMERSPDLLLSSVYRYIEGLGGELDLIVKFPGHDPVKLSGIRKRDEDSQQVAIAL